MQTIYLTEQGTRQGLDRLVGQLRSVLSATDSSYRISEEGAFSKVQIDLNERFGDFLFAEIKERIAERIVVSYKYDFFREHTKLNGLTPLQKELFLTAVISADLADDRAYCEGKISKEREISVDGLYHFRMQRLTAKWQEIVGCIPTYFSEDLYHNFMQYLIDDFTDRPVYVVGDRVYDEFYHRRHLSALIGDGTVAQCEKEILLCRGKEIHLIGKTTEEADRFLREFYGTRLFFHDEDPCILQ